MKKMFLILLLLCFFPCFCAGCQSSQGKLTSYDIKLNFDEQDKKIYGEEKVTFVNNYDNSFSELCFHLYPNAFREGAKNKVVSLAYFDEAYPNGESFGKIDVEKVVSGGENLEFAIEGEDENILKISLQEEVFPGEVTDFVVSFVTQIPNINHRFGYGDNSINVANFYPILCAYEEGRGFVQDLYVSNGDPFYSDIANYEVEIEYDENLTLASSGNVVSSICENGKKKDLISAQKVRDFAFVLSSKFEKTQCLSGDTEVNYFYYNDSTPEETLDLAKKCMDFYSDNFGLYPYSQISIVQSNFVYGGMEFPNIVLISDSLSKETSYYVVAHELAHQWWYGVVGNDQYNEAWVDEGLTEYSTMLFFENHDEYGFDYQTMITNANSSFKFFYNIYEKVCGKVETSMARSLDEFETEPEYVHSVYTQGVIMYDSLRELVGEKKLYACMRKYFEKMAYKNARGADLIAMFSKVSGKNLESFFDSFLNGKVVIN